MFQFRRFPTLCYFIHIMFRRLFLRGFPHSEICGSTDICSSPQLFAAYHVLLRLLLPRHSPCALSNLTVASLLVGEPVPLLTPIFCCPSGGINPPARHLIGAQLAVLVSRLSLPSLSALRLVSSLRIIVATSDLL